MSTDAFVLSRAIEFAARLHGPQVDKSGEPYILHPIRVMQLAKQRGLSIDMQCAAVLHDVLEDTTATLDEFERDFGAEITAAVCLLTKREGQSYDDFIEHRVCKANDEIIQLKLCDIADNTSPVRMTTDALKAMAATKYKPAMEKLEAELARRACAAGKHAWVSSGEAPYRCLFCGVM